MNLEKEIGVGVLYIKCNNCGKEYNDYTLGDFSYGYRLFRTNENQLYLYSFLIDDIAFNEIKDLVRKLLKDKGLEDSIKIADIFNEIFGEICDPISNDKIDATGKSYFKTCKYCKSHDIKQTKNNPLKSIRISVPIIQYTQWNKLSQDQKIEMVKKEIDKKYPQGF